MYLSFYLFSMLIRIFVNIVFKSRCAQSWSRHDYKAIKYAQILYITPGPKIVALCTKRTSTMRHIFVLFPVYINSNYIKGSTFNQPCGRIKTAQLNRNSTGFWWNINYEDRLKCVVLRIPDSGECVTQTYIWKRS